MRLVRIRRLEYETTSCPCYDTDAYNSFFSKYLDLRLRVIEIFSGLRGSIYFWGFQNA